MDALDSSVLGLIEGQFLERTTGRHDQRRGAIVEETESFRWLQGADQAATVCAGAERATVVVDCEGDVYEAFALRPDGTELIFRAAQDRCLAEGGRLFAALDALPETGRAGIDAGPARPPGAHRAGCDAVCGHDPGPARGRRAHRAGQGRGGAGGRRAGARAAAQ